MNHDVAVAWNWEHDEAFVADLERSCHELGMTFRSVTPGNVEGILEAAGAVRWGVLLDRAWESDPRFRRLNDIVAASGTRVLNPPELSMRMGNKADVNALLRERGVGVPRLVDFMPDDYPGAGLAAVTRDWKRPLWLKPAGGGGGDGVMELQEIPGQFPHGPEWRTERFVLQENAAPMILEGRPAWFRVFHVFGTIHAFWWHPKTHEFTTVTERDRANHGLECVSLAAAAVAGIAGLEIFSTEISLSAPGSPLVIDPVNDPVDFRRRSQAAGAIPDEALAAMISAIAKGLAAIVLPA